MARPPEPLDALPSSLFRLPEERTAKGVSGVIHALARRETYALHRNPYLLFGLLLGLPIPVTLLGVHLSALGLPLTWENAVFCLRGFPLHGWFLLHPLLFGVAFGALGTLARDRDRRILVLIDRLRADADTDGLTGLLNHRAFQERIREEAARADRDAKPVSLLFLDIDWFKDFNDRFGHPAGDRLLRSLAERVLVLVRPYDIVCRYGGEEFAVILPGMEAMEACQAAERIRSGVESQPFAAGPEIAARVSLSIGVALRHTEEPVTEWIDRADRRLYRAKASGRNRVCNSFPDESATAEDSPPSSGAAAAGDASPASDPRRRGSTERRPIL